MDVEKVNDMLKCMWFLVGFFFWIFLPLLLFYNWEPNNSNGRAEMWKHSKIPSIQYELYFVTCQIENETGFQMRTWMNILMWGKSWCVTSKTKIICKHTYMRMCEREWERECFRTHGAYVIWMKSCERRDIFRFVMAVFRLSLTSLW